MLNLPRGVRAATEINIIQCIYNIFPYNNGNGNKPDLVSDGDLEMAVSA
jgi:hypothetical protein